MRQRWRLTQSSVWRILSHFPYPTATLRTHLRSPSIRYWVKHTRHGWRMAQRSCWSRYAITHLLASWCWWVLAASTITAPTARSHPRPTSIQSICAWKGRKRWSSRMVAKSLSIHRPTHSRTLCGAVHSFIRSLVGLNSQTKPTASLHTMRLAMVGWGPTRRTILRARSKSEARLWVRSTATTWATSTLTVSDTGTCASRSITYRWESRKKSEWQWMVRCRWCSRVTQPTGLTLELCKLVTWRQLSSVKTSWKRSSAMIESFVTPQKSVERLAVPRSRTSPTEQFELRAWITHGL